MHSDPNPCHAPCQGWHGCSHTEEAVRGTLLSFMVSFDKLSQKKSDQYSEPQATFYRRPTLEAFNRHAPCINRGTKQKSAWFRTALVDVRFCGADVFQWGLLASHAPCEAEPPECFPLSVPTISRFPLCSFHVPACGQLFKRRQACTCRLRGDSFLHHSPFCLPQRPTRPCITARPCP